jgi:acetyl esterase/lipase
MARLDELEARWQEESQATSTALHQWRRQHPQATAQAVEAALDERLQALRARLLAELAPVARATTRPGPWPTANAAEPSGPRMESRADVPDSVVVERGVEFARHEGVSLRGDLYTPAAGGTYPALVLIHGGGWQIGSPAVYQHWGPYLAERGYVAFAASYRLSKPEQPSYPQSVYDVKAAVQFLRAQGPAARVDPERIGVMGNSAGGHLAALVALSGDSPKLANPYPNDAHRGVSARVKVAVPIYGVFDFVRQWEHDQLTRPNDQISEKYLGGTPMEIRDVYYEASPLSWATVQNNAVPFLVVWGTEDDIVEPESQSIPFVTALKRADTITRTVPVPGAPHFWISETPVLEPGSFTAYLAPRLMRFLAQYL